MDKTFLKKIHPPPSSGNTTMIANLALFIMLLAFFIVLVSKSEFKPEKASAVLENLKRTFTMRVFREGEGPSLSPDAEQGAGEGQSDLERAEAQFRSDFPGIEAQQIPSRGFLYVRMDEAVLFADQSSTKRKALEKLIQKTIMGSAGKKTPSMQLEIWLNVQGDVAKSLSGDGAGRILMSKAASLGRRMENFGVPPGYVTTGIQKGNPGAVSLFFRPYTPYAPVE